MKKKIIVSIVIIIVIGVGYFLLSPLWNKVKLDEALPVVSDQPKTEQVEEAPTIGDNLDTMDTAVKEKMTREIDAMKDKVMVKDEVMPPKGPVVLKEATLVARSHDVEGKVILLQVGDEKIVRFENLKTVNGPDLRIYLSAGLDKNDFIDLGPIRATEGNVNYTIPAGTDTTKYKNVLIWCRAFGVLFSYGQL